MEPVPKLSREAYVEAMRAKREELLGRAADAVNDAAPGQVIAGSEEQVRDLFADFRRQAYETALQLRVDAAEAALPPPLDPATGKRQRHKGRPGHRRFTIHDGVGVERTCWHGPSTGSSMPADAFLDAPEATVPLGARELVCRLNQNARSFDQAAENRARAAPRHRRGAKWRPGVEAEGKAVRAAPRSGEGDLGGTAADGRTEPGPTRVHLGSDGGKAPVVTDAAKKARRQKVKDQRRRRGQRCRPRPRAKAGADQKYKAFTIVAYYDETQQHRHVSVTGGTTRSPAS